MRLLSLTLLALCLALPAAADAPYKPVLHDPLPFDHASHTSTFAETGVTCVVCHPVGVDARATLPPPLSTCHGCHRGDARRAPRDAPSSCGNCHADTHVLSPESHAFAWIDLHGAAASARPASCRDCHEDSTCVQCHDDRGPLTANPHGPGVRALHGIEARIDPASCTTCHTGQSCTACHSGGSVPW
jgi:hypothetical protein